MLWAVVSDAEAVCVHVFPSRHHHDRKEDSPVSHCGFYHLQEAHHLSTGCLNMVFNADGNTPSKVDILKAVYNYLKLHKFLFSFH